MKHIGIKNNAPLIFCLAGALFISILASPIAGADPEMDTGTNVQIALLHKIFTFDSNMAADAGSMVNIGILYEPTDAASIIVKNNVKDSFKRVIGLTIAGLPVEISEISFESSDQLSSSIQSLDIIYITPGNSNNLSTITRICQQKKVRTFTGVSKLVSNGICVGITARDSKPKILINQTASVASGADFSPTLLKLAEVIQ